MRLALGTKEFMCLVVSENGTDNLADDLNVNFYDLVCLIKAWFWCFLSARIRYRYAFAASSLLCLSAGSVSLGTPVMSRLLILNSLDFILRGNLGAHLILERRIRIVDGSSYSIL